TASPGHARRMCPAPEVAPFRHRALRSSPTRRSSDLAVAAGGRFPVKQVAETLGVARSNLIERLAGRRRGRAPRYAIADDERLLPMVRQICQGRASNGYRRVTAQLNRQLAASGERVNPKRIYRLMRQNGLLLPRYTGQRPKRRHEGQVITLKSNLRGCSDGFEIRCWNGEVVRVAFSLDCCDREAMRFVATTGGISAEHVRDPLVESIEQRFGRIEKLPHPIEWLT